MPALPRRPRGRGPSRRRAYGRSRDRVGSATEDARRASGASPCRDGGPRGPGAVARPGSWRPCAAGPGAWAGLRAELRHGVGAGPRPAPDILGLGSGLPRAVPPTPSWPCSTRSFRACCCRSSCCSGPWRRRPRDTAALAPGAADRHVWSRSTVYRVEPLRCRAPRASDTGRCWWAMPCCRGWCWLLGDVAHAGPCRARLCWLLPLGSLSASAGLATAVGAVAFAPRAPRPPPGVRRWPCSRWATRRGWSPGCCTPADATSDPAGARAFALHRRGLLPAPVAALGLGGIWNAEVVPASRDACWAGSRTGPARPCGRRTAWSARPLGPP